MVKLLGIANIRTKAHPMMFFDQCTQEVAHASACRRDFSRAAAAALTLFSAAWLQAHEIGTTRVSVALRPDRAFNIEIVTDAAALAEKLAVSPGKGFEEKFRKKVKLVFDDTEVRPALSCSEASQAATIHLTGQVPPGARQFTWTYGWTYASYAMTLPGAPTQWLEGGTTATTFELKPPTPVSSRLDTIWRYLTLGFTHIVPNGFDHMLFVLGIYLLSGRARAVLWQVSAFTVAHSITLGLSMYGLVAVSPKIVEPMIAISIAYVAVENIFLSELKSWRVVLVFAFGLLHGMGFAGALQELALPRSEFITALVTFNLGVEAGQLAVIGAAFTLLGWHWSNRAWYRARVVVPMSLLIAGTAVYWTIERLSA